MLKIQLYGHSKAIETNKNSTFIAQCLTITILIAKPGGAPTANKGWRFRFRHWWLFGLVVEPFSRRKANPKKSFGPTLWVSQQSGGIYKIIIIKHNHNWPNHAMTKGAENGPCLTSLARGSQVRSWGSEGKVIWAPRDKFFFCFLRCYLDTV